MKRIFPVIWFGMLAVVTYFAASDGAMPKPFLFFVPAFMAAVGFAILRMFVFVLADEVLDNGHSLSVTNKGETVRVPLADIINVGTSVTRPPLVTLTLRTSTPLGRKIAFLPVQPFTLNPFASNAMIDDLIERVDRARRTAR